MTVLPPAVSICPDLGRAANWWGATLLPAPHPFHNTDPGRQAPGKALFGKRQGLGPGGARPAGNGLRHG